MDKLALKLAFFGAGMNFVVIKLGDTFRVEAPLLYALAMYVPAIVLGTAAWFMVPSFARSRTIVACVLVVAAGIFYATDAENHRGSVAFCYIVMALPIAALIVKNRCWWLCARVYVLSNALALGLALYFEYWVHGVKMVGRLHRLGMLVGEDGSYLLANPNIIGGQLALAAVLAFMLYLRSRAPRATSNRPMAELQPFGLGWTVFLALGCILTASRGAFVALLGGLGLLLLRGTRSQQSSKLNDLVAFSGVLLLILAFTAVAIGFTPWTSLLDRFDRNNTLTGSGRTVIWRHAYDIWRSNPRYLLVGTGTGVAPEVIGRYLGLTKGDDYETAALTAHNAFVEWGLTHGLLGMAAGIWMLAAICRTARKLDRRDRSVYRQTLLLCFCLASMNFVTFYYQFFVAAAALILSGMSQPPPRVRIVRRPQSEAARPATAGEPHGHRLRPKRRAEYCNPVSPGGTS